MNIFFLDRNIVHNARAHADMHVNKMILESGQLLASAHHMTNESAASIPGMYRLTHKNHPDAIWVRASINHYLYVMDLMDALNQECQYRFEHNKTHLTLAKVREWPFPDLPDVPFIDPPKCVHDDFKSMSDVVEAYRAYYRRDKASNPLFGYTKRNPPNWL